MWKVSPVFARFHHVVLWATPIKNPQTYKHMHTHKEEGAGQPQAEGTGQCREGCVPG